MKNFAPPPLVSVCIPIYNTESFLAQCLYSVFKQTFDSFEIVIVSDASNGRDEKGLSAKKIVKRAVKQGNEWRKKNKLSAVAVNYSEHSENRGILEVRRTLTYEARGEYCFHLDSDDELTPDALSLLWQANEQQYPFDIVHGSFVSGWYNENGEFITTEKTKCGAIYLGRAEGHEVFHKWLNHEISGNVCGKLIRRELFIKAYENIPYSKCNMADDFLIFFFISLFAKSYIGLENKIYRYRINSGMSSQRKIDSLEKWELICSASSVFTVIWQWILDFEEKSSSKILSDEEMSLLREQGRNYLIMSIHQLKERVIPSIQDSVYSMLCDYWGRNLVQKINNNTFTP